MPVPTHDFQQTATTIQRHHPSHHHQYSATIPLPIAPKCSLHAKEMTRPGCREMGKAIAPQPKVSSTFCVVSIILLPPALHHPSLSSLLRSPKTQAHPTRTHCLHPLCPLSLGLVHACAARTGTGGPNACPFRPHPRRGNEETGNRIDGSASSPPFFLHASLSLELGAIPTHARALHHRSHPLRHQGVPVLGRWGGVRAPETVTACASSLHQPLALPGGWRAHPHTGAARAPRHAF